MSIIWQGNLDYFTEVYVMEENNNVTNEPVVPVVNTETPVPVAPEAPVVPTVVEEPEHKTAFIVCLIIGGLTIVGLPIVSIFAWKLYKKNKELKAQLEAMQTPAPVVEQQPVTKEEVAESQNNETEKK